MTTQMTRQDAIETYNELIEISAKIGENKAQVDSQIKADKELQEAAKNGDFDTVCFILVQGIESIADYTNEWEGVPLNTEEPYNETLEDGHEYEPLTDSKQFLPPM